jgi:hypothetical protein
MGHYDGALAAGKNLDRDSPEGLARRFPVV